MLGNPLFRCRGGFLAALAAGAAAVGVAGLLADVSAAALPPGCGQSGLTVTCTYTSGSNAFVVPAGVSSIHVVAVGGVGSGVTGGAGGGHGAVVSGDVAAITGQRFMR